MNFDTEQPLKQEEETLKQERVKISLILLSLKAALVDVDVQNVKELKLSFSALPCKTLIS